MNLHNEGQTTILVKYSLNLAVVMLLVTVNSLCNSMKVFSQSTVAISQHHSFNWVECSPFHLTMYPQTTRPCNSVFPISLFFFPSNSTYYWSILMAYYSYVSIFIILTFFTCINVRILASYSAIPIITYI